MSKDEIDELLSRGWAQASILLNLGRTEQAASVGLSTLDLDPHFAAMQPLSGIAGAKATGHHQAPPGWSFFVPERGLVVLAAQVWDEFVMSLPLHRHVQTISTYPEATWVPINRRKWSMQDEINRGRPTLDEFPDLDV